MGNGGPSPIHDMLVAPRRPSPFKSRPSWAIRPIAPDAPELVVEPVRQQAAAVELVPNSYWSVHGLQDDPMRDPTRESQAVDGHDDDGE